MDSMIERAFRGEADIDAVIALRRAIERSAPSGSSLPDERLRARYLRSKPGWWRELRVWEADNDIVALADLRSSDEPQQPVVAYLQAYVEPGDSRGFLFDRTLDWAETTTRDRFGAGSLLEITVRAEHEWRRAPLEVRGYEIDRLFHLMARSLTAPLPAVTPVGGYRLRPLRGADEVDAWLALYADSFQDHYDFHPIARGDRLQVMTNSDYLAELDLVVEEDSGNLAALCICDGCSRGNGRVEWHIDLVSTHRDHRRRGLAGWLIAETMARVGALGGAEIELEVDATSPTGADRLYANLGFAVTGVSTDYRRTL